MDHQRNTMRQSYGRDRRQRNQPVPAFGMTEETEIKVDDFETQFPGYSLAMVYSPYQNFRWIYDSGEAICRGTIFRELDKPLAVGRDK